MKKFLSKIDCIIRSAVPYLVLICFILCVVNYTNTKKMRNEFLSNSNVECLEEVAIPELEQPVDCDLSEVIYMMNDLKDVIQYESKVIRNDISSESSDIRRTVKLWSN